MCFIFLSNKIRRARGHILFGELSGPTQIMPKIVIKKHFVIAG
jgi:hypothetical protein